MGTLEVDVNGVTIQSYSGDQGNVWNIAALNYNMEASSVVSKNMKFNKDCRDIPFAAAAAAAKISGTNCTGTSSRYC